MLSLEELERFGIKVLGRITCPAPKEGEEVLGLRFPEEVYPMPMAAVFNSKGELVEMKSTPAYLGLSGLSIYNPLEGPPVRRFITGG